MNIVIIGSNRGIGLEFCRQFLTQKNVAKVFATCRKASADLIDLKEDARLTIVEDMDVSQLNCFQKLVETIGPIPVDLVIHNSGIYQPVDLASFNLESIQTQIQVNTMGPVYSTLSLIPLIRKGGKMVFLTSKMGSIQDNTSGGSYGYRMSKCALNMFAKCLSLDLKSQDIAIGLLHPGWVKTDMTKHNGLITVQESVTGLRKVIEEKVNLCNTGIYIDYKSDEIPW